MLTRDRSVKTSCAGRLLFCPVDHPGADTALREEDEQVTRQRIVPKHVPDDHHQAVCALTSVHRLRRHEQAYAWRQAQHRASPSSRTLTSRRTLSSSKAGPTRRTCPERKTTSAIDTDAGRSD